MEEKEAALKLAMENAEANAKKLGDIEEQLTTVLKEKEQLFADLNAENERLVETEDALAVMTNEKSHSNSHSTKQLRNWRVNLTLPRHSSNETRSKRRKLKNSVPESKKTEKLSRNWKERNLHGTDRSML